MSKYRKKPVVIEAEKFNVDTYRNSEFLQTSVRDKAHGSELWFGMTVHDSRYYIDTLEGWMTVGEGDYVIKGIQGEFYPCKSDIFEATYDIVDGSYDGSVSDGYHTFDELYHHRMILFSIICNQNKEVAWKSKLHHDGTMYDDYFIVGIATVEGGYTYHYHMDNWDYFNVKELELAPEWDGHTSKDITRLSSLVR